MQKGILPLHKLVTIRCGEPSFNPINGKVEPASHEMLKIAGKGASWECLFYDAAQSACIIHANRPLECRLLECWDTKAIEAVSGKGCVDRFDLVEEHDPIRNHIARHEQQCAYAKALPLLDHLSSSPAIAATIEQLQDIMQQDLQLRDQAVSAFSLSLQQELFYFGRPLFQSLQHPNLRVDLTGQSIRLQWTDPA